jgi:RNA polymerase sigma-70 factor, ECF subfamily
MHVHHLVSEAKPFIGSVPESRAANALPLSRTTSEITEENISIAERLQARDPEIIDELILRYQVRLRGYLTRLTADRELSEDLLQEIWMRVMTRGSQFKGDSQIGTWLFAIARNLVFDLRRKRSWSTNRDVVRETGDERWFELLPSREKNPFDYCADIEHAHLITEALLTLKPRYRELVELRLHREMSLDEIAQATGSSLSSVKTRLYRAMRLLRLRLKGTLSVQPKQLRAAS